MNQKLLEQAFGVSRDYRCARADTHSGSVQFRLELKPEALLCPRCGTTEAVIRKGRRCRVLQAVPIGLRPVYLVTEVPRCLCRGCGLIFELAPPVARAAGCHKRKLAGFVSRLSLSMTAWPPGRGPVARRLNPGGILEVSPVLQHWVGRKKCDQAPEGRPSRWGLGRSFGTLTAWTPYPTLKRWA